MQSDSGRGATRVQSDSGGGATRVTVVGGTRVTVVAMSLLCMLKMSSSEQQVQEGAMSWCTTNSDLKTIRPK